MANSKIIGLENISVQELNFELQRGAKFVTYYYCVSLLVVTFRRSSDIYFVRAGEGSAGHGLPWTVLTVLLGWWGIPWGPIWTVQSLYVNLRGGKDVTAEVVNALSTPAAPTAAAR